MKIIAIDSSGLVATVAIMEENNLIAEYTIHYKKTHSQTLLPMLDEIKKMIELDLAEIDAIAIAKGPGSFTGLRIGSATAKGLGLALNKPIIEVSTLEGLAYGMYGTSNVICPIMDARRNQVYTGFYEFKEEVNAKNDDCKLDMPQEEVNAKNDDCKLDMPQEEVNAKIINYKLSSLQEEVACDISECIEICNLLQRPVTFLGDGVAVFKEKILAKINVPVSFAPADRNLQSAAHIAALALQFASSGKLIEAGEHKPTYLRLSQAERERNERT